MFNQHYVHMARKHWQEWLPKKVTHLKAAGEFEAALQTAANRCRAEVDDLRAQGFREHEAEEVALPQFILLKPEPEASMSPAQRRELAAKEAEYQRLMRDSGCADDF